MNETTIASTGAELPTLLITRDMLDSNNVYVGGADVAAWPGHIEIAASLGIVTFPARLSATGRIRALAGSGIEAGEGIKAGDGIKAGLGIEAGWGIKAGEGIKAGSGIEAGLGIEAGSGIKAGWGIKTGLAIIANHISARLRIFAGLCSWRIPEPSEMEIRADIRSGTIAFGTHVPPRDLQLSKSGTQ